MGMADAWTPRVVGLLRDGDDLSELDREQIVKALMDARPDSEIVAVLRIQLTGALRERDENEAKWQRAVELRQQSGKQCARAQKQRDEALARLAASEKELVERGPP